MSHSANEAILKYLLAEVLEVACEDPRPAAISPDTLNSHAGHYRHSHIDLEILAEVDRLKAIATLDWHKESGNADMVASLIPVSDREFVIKDGEFEGNRVVFFPESGGRPKHVRFLNRIIWEADAPTF